MAEDLKISHGEPQWDVKYNNLVNTVEAMVGITDNLKWTEQTKDGLVFANGVECTAGGYSYTTLGSSKLVMLSVGLAISSNLTGASVPNAITLPESIQTGSPWYDWLAETTNYQITGCDITLYDTSGNTNRQWNGNRFIITKLYVA